MPGLNISIAKSRVAEEHRRKRQEDIRCARIAYRVRILPEQLERARNRVAMLEKEAAELGMKDLLL